MSLEIISLCEEKHPNAIAPDVITAAIAAAVTVAQVENIPLPYVQNLLSSMWEALQMVPSNFTNEEADDATVSNEG